MTATKLAPVVWEGIVKVQRSLFTSSNQPKKPRVLISNQDQTVRWEGLADKDRLVSSTQRQEVA